VFNAYTLIEEQPPMATASSISQLSQGVVSTDEDMQIQQETESNSLRSRDRRRKKIIARSKKYLHENHPSTL
jgi:hypothetical protein